MSSKYSWVLALVLNLPVLTMAQFTVKGHVYSGEEKKPLPFAAVFLSGTTKGTLTDSVGQFSIANVPAGTFDLIVSYTGYATLRTTVQPQQEKAYRFVLKPADNRLNEVVVSVHRHEQGSAEEIAQFVNNFIGITQNAKRCRLLNAEALRFDDTPTTLTATAREPLVIENLALGYRLTYYLDSFRYDYSQQRVSYQGHPLFEPLVAKTSQQADEWQQNRQNAYRGSLMHFMRALYQKRLAEEGFLIQPVTEVKSRDGSRRFIGAPADTTVALPSLTKADRLVNFPMAAYKRILDSLSSTPIIRFDNWMQVIYALKREPADYQRYRETPEHKYDITPQRSFLRMLAPSVEIDFNGRFDLQRLLVEGYWAWELMAESLPTDYEPDR